MELDLTTAKVFRRLWEPRRYKCAYGGRGSGKTYFFADMAIAMAINEPSIRMAGVREVQKSLRDSSKAVIESRIKKHKVGHHFEVQNDRIKFKNFSEPDNSGEMIFFGMSDQTAETAKSTEGLKYVWVEEAQTLTKRSAEILLPTVRAEDSEIWFSYNRRLETDWVDQFFNEPHPDKIAVKADWSDNPWFPKVLETERKRCLVETPNVYDHIWEGDYVSAWDDGYYQDCLTQAQQDGRITRDLKVDPVRAIHTFHDIGGAGARADHYAIWVCQIVGTLVHILDYYESQGQALGTHMHWLRSNGYERANIWLPHDGGNHNNISGKTYADHWREGGFTTSVVANQGKGAATARIEAARRSFGTFLFDTKKTEAGRKALGWYHEKKDEARGIGLGPEHDWASHAADAFGMMAQTVPRLVKPSYHSSAQKSYAGIAVLC